jgi:hypothetical protein
MKYLVFLLIMTFLIKIMSQFKKLNILVKIIYPKKKKPQKSEKNIINLKKNYPKQMNLMSGQTTLKPKQPTIKAKENMKKIMKKYLMKQIKKNLTKIPEKLETLISEDVFNPILNMRNKKEKTEL